MKQPNVLLICVDHWPGRLMHHLGKKDIYTPTLDRLAQAGITFDNAHSTTPTCIPARRALMTGTTSKTHGDRVFDQRMRMPNLRTLPDVFKDNGYQTFAVGKLHVYPQRDRIGFDEALIHEEGRHHLGLDKDDYEQFLTDSGFSGEELSHGIGVNDYPVRTWHLEEKYHPTYWTTKTMCRTIQRRNPEKPGFWYVSYSAPHPPITPPKYYLDLYRDLEMTKPHIGEWAEGELPYALAHHKHTKYGPTGPKAIEETIKGFHAQCTYVDHQLKLLIGTLREEGILDDTIIVFTSDHGDMLGNHKMWAKPTMFDDVVKVPMIVVPNDDNYKRTGFNKVNHNLVALRDIFPTLLDLCSIPVHDEIEGLSMFGQTNRKTIYAEHWEDERAIRMIRDEQYKLIYYPVGNEFQFFDLINDQNECANLIKDKTHKERIESLKKAMIKEFYGSDKNYTTGSTLVGQPHKDFQPSPLKEMAAQRGWRK